MRNQNNLLKQKLNGLTRQLDDTQSQVNLLESMKHKYSNSRTPSSQDAMQSMLLSMQNDWKQAVSLLAEVEEEKAENLSRGITSMRLEMSQKSRELDAREECLNKREFQVTQFDTINRLIDRNS